MASTHDRTWVFLCCESTGLAEFERVADEQGWPVAARREGDGRVLSYEQVRQGPENPTWIHYIDDPVSGHRFIAVKGPGANAVARALGGSLALRTEINVLRLAEEASSEAEKMDSAMELAVVFKEPNAAALNLLKVYYTGASEPLRRQVVKALGYRGWAEGIDLLDEIAASDPSPEIQQDAARIAQLWRAQAGS